MGSRRLPIQQLLPFLTALFLLCTGVPSIAADVSLAWGSSVSENVLGYKVYAGNASRVYGDPITLGNQTTYTLTGLTSGPWYFAVTAYDSDGNESDFSNEVSRTIGTVADTTPPVISGLTSARITTAGAAITWTTNEASTSQVEYGPSVTYGNIALNSSLDLSHSQTLSGLLAGTLYHYRVRSIDAVGNAAVSGDYTFATAVPIDSTPPVISSVTGSSISSTGATITWTTNEAADTRVDYGATTNYDSFAFNGTLGMSHSQALSGLTGGTLYHYRVRSADAAGNAAISGDYTFTTPAPPDTTAPVISGVGSANLTSSGATIGWTTNEASTSQVEYGTTAGYGTTSALNRSIVTGHTQALSGLSASTLYHYRVKSADAAGNAAVSVDFTFTTPAPPDTTAPVISGVSSTNLTSSGATIGWTTNEASTTQVEYGTTTGYGTSSSLNGSMVTGHTQALSGLSASTLYHYRVRSKDIAGNAAVSGDNTFTTAASDITDSTLFAQWFRSDAVQAAATTIAPSLVQTQTDTPTQNSSNALRSRQGKDKTPPKITGIASSNISNTSATIIWSTNEAADTQVDYGTTISYEFGSIANLSMVIMHSQNITDLKPGTRYHYRVRSKDYAGNLSISSDRVFTTIVKGTAPVVSMVSLSDVTSQSARISWSTDKPSNSEVEYWIAGGTSDKAVLGDFVTQHSISLNNLKEETHYQFNIKSTDSDSNQAISPDYALVTRSSSSSVVTIPRFFNLQDQNALGEEVLEEIALTNLGDQPAALTLTALDSDGNLITGQNIANPTQLQMNSLTQSARLDMDIFGEGLALSGAKGWIKVESTTANMGGFSLAFGTTLKFMDGTSLGDVPLTDFAFTEIETNGSTRINVANNNPYDATVVFDLMKADGTKRSTQYRVVKANGALVADLFADVFASIVPDATNYVRVNSTKGVLSFELMKKTSGDTAAMAGQDITAGGAVLYSPHYVVGSEWNTMLSVINLDSKAGKIQFQFVGENGVQIGSARTLDIPAGGKLYVNDPAFFQPPSLSQTYTGYVKIKSDGVRLAGSAMFGDRSGTSFAAALPLVYNLQNSMFYGHVVSTDLYRSGIAIVNPNDTDATAIIELYAADGTSLEKKSESIPAGKRCAKLLTEYFPSQAGQNQTSGYIRIKSDKPLASYSLFGTGNLSVMSAIPGKTIQ